MHRCNDFFWQSQRFDDGRYLPAFLDRDIEAVQIPQAAEKIPYNGDNIGLRVATALIFSFCC